MNWFLCMLVNTLPIEVRSIHPALPVCRCVNTTDSAFALAVSCSQAVLRVWDCMFCEGNKVLFRACLGLM